VVGKAGIGAEPVDMILPQAQQLGSGSRRRGRVFFTNAQDGKGVAAVAQAAQELGWINQRRRDRGMLPRPGCSHWFPNVQH